MHIYRIHIRNFRSIENITIFPEKTNVIIGENNSGKSNILHALNIILNPSNSQLKYLKETDFPDWLNENERKIKENSPLIELEFRYDAGDENVYDAILRGKLEHTEEGQCYFTICYEYYYDEDAEEFIPSMFFVVSDDLEENRKNIFTNKHRGYFPYYYLPALRDIKDEIKYSQATLWGKYLKDIDISDQKETIIDFMDKANQVILENESFKSMSNSIKNAVGSIFNMEAGLEIACTISSINSDELLKNTEISFKSPGCINHFPLECYGHGTQNSIFYAVFKAYIEYIKNKNNITMAFLGIEEPEAHLHPHAQRVLFKDIDNIKAQCFITTHSTYITDMADPSSMIILRRENGKTIVSQANTYHSIEEGVMKVLKYSNDNQLTQTEKDDIKRWVSLEKSELYFARCVYLCEGDTERLTIPIMAKLLNINFDKLGISCLKTDGGTKFIPLLKLCKRLNIRFIVQTDDDEYLKIFKDCVRNKIIEIEDGQYTDLVSNNRKDEIKEILKSNNIFVLSGDFEDAMLSKGYTDKYKEEVISAFNNEDIFDKYQSINPIGKNGISFNSNTDDKQKIKWMIKNRDRDVKKVNIAFNIVSSFTTANDIPEEFIEIIESAKQIANLSDRISHEKEF